MVDLSRRVIFITGAASGIGRATAAACRDAGAVIIAADIKEPEEIAEAAGVVHDDIALRVDVADEAQIEAAANEAKAKYGGVHGVVNCAGVIGVGCAHGMEVGEWERVLRIHLTGSMLTIKHFVPPMMERGAGAIVNLSSIYGITGGVGQLPYATAKAALIQLTRACAADYGGFGVRVNAVSPGVIDTPMTSFLKDHPQADGLTRMHLLKRRGEAVEVARAIRFLLSDEASFITGANLPVDGGFSAARINVAQ